MTIPGCDNCDSGCSDCVSPCNVCERLPCACCGDCDGAGEYDPTTAESGAPATMLRCETCEGTGREEDQAVIVKAPYKGPWAWLADCKMDGTGWK